MKKLKDFLTKFNYYFVEDGNKIIIQLDNKFEVTVSLNNEIYFITCSTVPWSPLTGFFKLSLYKSLIINSVGFIMVFLMLELLKFSKYQYDYTYLLIIASFLYIMWFTYYLIKFEILKSKIEQILNEKEL